MWPLSHVWKIRLIIQWLKNHFVANNFMTLLYMHVYLYTGRSECNIIYAFIFKEMIQENVFLLSDNKISKQGKSKS